MLLAVIALFCSMTVISGCGNKAADTSAMSAPPPPPGGPASAPASNQPAQKIKFDKFQFDKPAKLVTNQNGIGYYHFAYTDQEGKVYNCQLPAAMAQGEYTADEWIRTFDIYKLPKVIGQKKVSAPGSAQSVDGFPLVSPKPRSQPTQDQPQQTQPAQARESFTMPPMPSGGATPGAPPAAAAPPPQPMPMD